MVELVDIRFSEIGPDYLRATMPVDARTWQPFGLLHGGASVVLAETLGSVGANCCVDPDRYYCVGQEINANHLRAVRSGRVTGTARPIHVGRPLAGLGDTDRGRASAARRDLEDDARRGGGPAARPRRGRPPVNRRLLLRCSRSRLRWPAADSRDRCNLPEKSKEVVVRPAPGAGAEPGHGARGAAPGSCRRQQ